VIPAKENELRHAFEQHTKLAKNGTSPSHYLLLFYAVECGLKSIFLNKNPNYANTNNIPQFHGHDLERWIKDSTIPANAIGATPKIHLQTNNSSCSIKDTHQAWRYGIVLSPTDEQKLVNWLKQIHNWIEEEI